LGPIYDLTLEKHDINNMNKILS